MKNNNYGFLKGLLRAFTLAEVLIAIAIVGVIAGLVLPTTISKAQNRGFEQSYSRNVQTMEDAVNALIVSENKDFFKSVMYSDTTPSSYDNTSGEFIKKYLKVSRYCGSGTDNAKLCFPNTYFKYNGNTKEIYNPNFAGACAKLKNGASICLQPQIGATGAKGIIDLNGPSGPNVIGRDLREFTLRSKTQASALDKTQAEVAVTTAPNLGSSDPCADPTSLACCQTKTAALPAACCTNYPDEFASNPACAPADPCVSEPKGLACCQKTGIKNSNKYYCCKFDALKATDACAKRAQMEVILSCQHWFHSGIHKSFTKCTTTAKNPPTSSEKVYVNTNLGNMTCTGTTCTAGMNYSGWDDTNVLKGYTTIKPQNHSYTCGNTFYGTIFRPAGYVPSNDSRLYAYYEYKKTYTGDLIGYTGRVVCWYVETSNGGGTGGQTDYNGYIKKDYDQYDSALKN